LPVLFQRSKVNPIQGEALLLIKSLPFFGRGKVGHIGLHEFVKK
jgi:hypothetical protein